MKSSHIFPDAAAEGAADVRSVRLIRRGQYLLVSPPVEELANQLQGAEHMLDDDSSAAIMVPIPLLWKHSERGVGTCLRGLAGLEDAAADWLRANDRDPVYGGERPAPWPSPSARAAQYGPPDQEFLDLVSSRDRGIVRYDPSRVAVERLVAQVAAAWPRLAHIVVFGSRQEDVRRLAAGLKELGVPVTVLDGVHKPARAGRLVVATPSSFHRGLLKFEHRTVIFWLDAAHACQDQAGGWWANSAWRARVFGFLPVAAQLSPSQRTFLASFYGTADVTVPEHGLRPRDVQFAFVKVAGGPAVRGRSELDIKRAGIWHNPVRNRKLAKLAHLLCRGDKGQLAAEFHELAVPELQLGKGMVRTLVESVEHARVLSRERLGAVARAGEGAWTVDLDPEEAESLWEGRWAASMRRRNLIVTAASLPEVAEADVVVRADGGVGPLTLPRSVTEVESGTAHRPLLVIDVNDRHHPALRKRARARKEAYLDAGWRPAGASADGALASFDRFVWRER